MRSLVFWNNWLREYKWILYITMSVFVFCMLFMWFSYLKGDEAVLHWEKLQEQKIAEATIHTFRLGPFELRVPGESYVIFEYFNGSDLIPNLWASYTFLLVILLSAMVILAVITTLERFWFYAGILVFILFIASLKLEVLQVFGQRNIIPTLIVVSLFSGLAFYFKSFRPDIRFSIRLSCFMILLAGMVTVIAYFSGVPFPLLHLAVTGYVPGMVLSLLFIIMVAHEVFAAFLYISSQNSKTAFRDFMIISVIWLANLIITNLHEMGSIKWNFIYINLYFLITVSAVLGFWGFRHRESLYANIISFHPFGAYFFLAMGAITFAFIGHMLGNSNNAAIHVVRSMIIYSQLGFGLIFMLYFMSNFLGVMEKNLSVYKVLYKPTRMPYFTFRLAGLIVLIAFIAYSNWRSFVFQGMAGFYNSMGDLYSLFEGDFITETYFTQAASYSFQDHHSNYMLAKIKSSNLDLKEARRRYGLASGKDPSEYSLANGGNLSVWEKKLYEAIDLYRDTGEEGLRSPAIQNNLGFAYARTAQIDSASFYLSQARENRKTHESAEINFFALAAMENIPVKADSVVKLFKSSSTGVLGNALALVTIQNQPFDIPLDPLKDDRLNLYTATLLNNYILRNVHTLDTVFTTRASRIISNPANADFSESLKLTLAFAYYHQSNVRKALEILAELSFISESEQGKYNYLQGLWVLEQGSPESASSYFNYAIGYEYKKARLYNAIALTEARQIDQALMAWDSVESDKDDAGKFIASSIKRILKMPPSGAASLKEEDKYQFCRYRIGAEDTTLFNRLINSFANSNYKVQALLDMSRKLFQAGNTISAIRYFSRISGLEVADSKLYEDVQFFELEMLASRREVHQITQQINKGVAFNNSRSLEKLFYAALVYEASGDLTNAAKNYEILGTYNPYYENGIIAAADFFKKRDERSMKSYDFLAEAIHVNSRSVRLLTAYAAEAARVGFDEYAASAMEQIRQLKAAR